MKETIKLFVFFFLGVLSSYGQDAHFSNMDYSPMNINPGLAGANYGLQANASYRTQWNSVGTPFQTIAASFDMRVNENSRNKNGHFAVGFNFYNDRAGETRISTNQASFNAAYHLMIDRQSTIGLGMFAGFGQRSLDASSGMWGNQYDGFAYDPTMASGETFSNANFTHLDVGTGIVYTFGANERRMRANNGLRINAGYAVFHVNRPSYSFIGEGEDPLYMRHAVFANGSIGIPGSTMFIDPGVYFQLQGPSTEFLIGADYRVLLNEGSKVTGNIKRSSVAFGAYFRARDAIVARFIYEFSGLSIGFSYDFNISTLSEVSSGRGGAEFFLRWRMNELPGTGATRSRI
jgi:type IX secretion system PorP/SprF family membrane protein